uniref:MADS-box domain-containing protein n=1 Tax=Leersia perrieri TaxID=77586 RepID=A0A0D9XUZ0_9ORYZ
MGRVKLKIKKLENSSGRHVTYSKRRSGILKKAKELSILCDIPLILLMFSPTDKPTICVGDHSSIEDVITKYAQQTPQERAKRKLESLEALKKTFKKLDHDFQNDMQLPLGLTGDPSTSSWFHASSGAEGQQPIMLPEDPSLLHQRDIGCSASTSLQSYPGYFSMSKQSTDNAGGEHHHQHHNLAAAAVQQPEFSQADCLTSLQLGAQFPYQSTFDHTSLLNDRLFIRQDMDQLHDHNAAAAAAAPMDFGCQYDLPRPGDEASFQNWASAACGANMYDHQQQQQQPAQRSDY